MSIETHRVVIGAAGWKHAAWLDSFYSDDLPEEWQLGFYSNEFSVLYVPAADWLNETELADWMEDVSDSFRFILEVPAKILSDKAAFIDALNKAKQLNKFCLGFVFQLEQSICDDISRFSFCCEAAQIIAPVCLDANDIIFTNELKAILVSNNITEVWNGDLTAKALGLSRGRLAVSKVAAENLDMRHLRAVMETCLSISNDGCISVLILEGDPPSLEMLRNADTLLNLL